MINRRSSPVSMATAANATPAAARRQSDARPMGSQRHASALEAVAPSTNSLLAPEPEANEKLQRQWNEAICRNMDLAKGYAQVAVLIVKWADHLDDLSTGDEVKRLTSVFRNDFHYITVAVSLNEESAPQHQLIHEITGFLKHFDGPNNLLIIYYTGHAGFNQDSGELEFYARNAPEGAPGAGYADQCASWNVAESLFLKSTEADTLAILDTCYASNVTKGAQDTGRAYQLLAASGHNRMTAGPGHRSFTTAMIESLKECLDENGDRPFSLWKLSSKINEKQYRRQNPCFPHDRLKKHDRQIELAPLKEKRSKKDDNKMVLTQRASGADLTLCFALGFNPVTQDHIEKLARGLPQAFETAGLMLQRIDWVSLEQRPPVDFKSTVSALNVAHRWLQKAFPDRKRSARLQEAPLEAPLGGPLGAALKVGTDDSSTRRKLPQSDGVPTNAETAEIDGTELDNTPAEATPSSVEEPLLQHDPDNSASDATRAPLMEQTVSFRVGSIAQLTAAVIGMGLLSCVTTVLCTRAALKAFG